METSAEYAVAAFEFQRYLSDQVPPLMIEEEFAILLQSPPAALVEATMYWVTQSRPRLTATMTADLILHAVRKISLMGEFDLVPRPALHSFLKDYCHRILEHCPVPERPRLVEAFAPLIEFRAPPPPVLPVRTTAMQEATARRMEVFLDQLAKEAPGERRDEVASEFMSVAAHESSSRAELEATLSSLKGVGIDPATENVLNSIARSLPGWGALNIPAGAAPRRERLGAMRQIVTLGEDAEEVAKRFREMVHAAIAQFNRGDVGRAQSILVLAQQMVTEEKVQPVYVEALRNASQYLDMARLKAAAEKPESLPALRTVMSFFHALSPDGLLKSLRGETDENRRHDLSALIEAHGPIGRARALELLDAPEAATDAPFAAAALRILRRMPRPDDSSAEREVWVILKHANRGTHPMVATQAIYCLGQARDERAERALLGLLRFYEGFLARPAALPGSITTDDISGLLDRTCDALARFASPMCLRALVEHGMKTQPELGDCAKRLAAGAQADFSTHPELMNQLVEALRAELPKGLLGLRLRKEMGRSASFVRALSGTPSPVVTALFQEIVRKHGDEEYGTLAAEALQAFAAKARPPEAVASTFSGDLGFFGLPMLLQTLAQGGMTGLLTLIDNAGAPAAKLWLLEGRLRQASHGRLGGEDAIYELLIRPFPGAFAFVHRKDVPRTGVLEPPRELTGLVFEGVRRHDEWKRSAALVGDDARLAVTGSPRDITTDEPQDLVEAVWAAASSGSTAKECDTKFPVDSHRVRRLLASWVEVNALKLA
ncbi:MAG: DUF4388 domain-containing protein [Vicinamibacteria bacterium]|nr:DUF4388 domain-containing protein [Vicinamibacteria bacterium]